MCTNGANDTDLLPPLPLDQRIQTPTHKRQPRTSSLVVQEPRFDILKPKVPFKNIVFEEDRRRSNVFRYPPELLDRVLVFREGIRGVEGDFEVERRIRDLRLSRRRIWTVEDFSWHIDIGIAGGERTRSGELNPKGPQSRLLHSIPLTWEYVTTPQPRPFIEGCSQIISLLVSSIRPCYH